MARAAAAAPPAQGLCPRRGPGGGSAGSAAGPVGIPALGAGRGRGGGGGGSAANPQSSSSPATDTTAAEIKQALAFTTADTGAARGPQQPSHAQPGGHSSPHTPSASRRWPCAGVPIEAGNSHAPSASGATDTQGFRDLAQTSAQLHRCSRHGQARADGRSPRKLLPLACLCWRRRRHSTV